MVAPAVPDLTEEVLDESIDARTDSLVSLRELGPPDLVHLLKQGVRNPVKQTGVYHHVTGVDASFSASLAAYINTLTYKDNGPNAISKIVEGVYCCYNAFSRLDMRVHVSIPGTVDCYCIDERGEKRKASDELWLETYLCSVLRAYSYADDGSGDNIRKIVSVRRFNPVTNTETEHRFLNAAEQLFFRGWQLGSDSVVQVPTNVSNHLTTGLLKYLETTGRYASGINLFEKLRTQSVEVSSLLAKVQFMGNEEVAGVRTLYQSLQKTPMDYVMLDTQAEFLLKKAQSAGTPELKEERLRLALGCADRSTVAAPSEFGTWARLAQVYVAMEDWEHALTTLNSCPMFTYQDKDTSLMPEPRDVNLPILAGTRLDEIDSEPESRFSEQVDPSLLGLKAASYRGTFKKAYSILTEMAAKIGWDQLLRIRSSVFVMEEEYRSEKQGATLAAPSKRTGSIDGVRDGTPDPTANGDEKEGGGDGDDDESEESRDSQQRPAKTAANGTNGRSNGVEKPSNTIDPREVRADSEKARPGQGAVTRAALTEAGGVQRRAPVQAQHEAALRAMAGQPVHGAVRGPARLHHLADADGAVPDAADAVQEVGRGVGGSGGAGGAAAARGRGGRGVPGVPVDALQPQSADGGAAGVGAGQERARDGGVGDPAGDVAVPVVQRVQPRAAADDTHAH